MANPKTKSELPSKIAAILKARDKAKDLYTQADALLDEVLQVLSTGDEVELPDGRKVVVIDNYAGKNKCFRVHGIARFELKVIGGAA